MQWNDETELELMAVEAPEPRELFWFGRARGVWPLESDTQLCTVLIGLEAHGFVIAENAHTGAWAQALGMPAAMTVEVYSGEVGLHTVARADASDRPAAMLRTYNGVNHPVREGEGFDFVDATVLMWTWVTAQRLADTLVLREILPSRHRREG